MAENNANESDNESSIKTNHHIISKVPNFCFPTPAERLANLSQAVSTISTEELNQYRSASAFI
ncbi:MAG: hypothetical protein ACJAUT_000159 [Cellvibrionaceae bacterium]|jgi:hypothetical protein